MIDNTYRARLPFAIELPRSLTFLHMRHVDDPGHEANIGPPPDVPFECTHGSVVDTLRAGESALCHCAEQSALCRRRCPRPPHPPRSPRAVHHAQRRI